MDAPSQHRPAVVLIPPANDPGVLLGAQDGRVYVVDAANGAVAWQSADLGLVQAAPGAFLRVFGADDDLVFAAGRNQSNDTMVYALDASNGEEVWSFRDEGGLGIGAVGAAGVVDYERKRFFFASRRRVAGANTLWCLDITNGDEIWAVDVGSIDGAPIPRGDRIYVGTNLGEVKAVEVASGDTAWSFPSGDGAVKGFVFVDTWSNDMYFATTNRVWAVTDNGAEALLKWATAPGAIPRPSTPLFAPGGIHPYVGGGDGRLYEIDVTTGAPAIPPMMKSIALGQVISVVGSPSLDVRHDLLYVGTEAGVIHAVRRLFP